MKNKIMAAIIASTMVIALSTTIITKAFEGVGIKSIMSVGNDKLVNEAKGLLDVALNKRTFYDYNMAYHSILRIENIAVRDQLLGQLASIGNEVYTDEILEYLRRFTDIAKEGSIRVYDDTESILRQATLYEFDKEYLLGELTSWGHDKVYSADYVDGSDKIIYAWNMLSYGTETNLNSAIKEAETAINKVKNKGNKEYLEEQLDMIKLKSEFTVIDIK